MRTRPNRPGWPGPRLAAAAVLATGLAAVAGCAPGGAATAAAGLRTAGHHAPRPGRPAAPPRAGRPVPRPPAFPVRRHAGRLPVIVGRLPCPVGIEAGGAPVGVEPASPLSGVPGACCFPLMAGRVGIGGAAHGTVSGSITHPVRGSFVGRIALAREQALACPMMPLRAAGGGSAGGLSPS